MDRKPVRIRYRDIHPIDAMEAYQDLDVKRILLGYATGIVSIDLHIQDPP
jgi:hypothetical protein